MDSSPSTANGCARGPGRRRRPLRRAARQKGAMTVTGGTTPLCGCGAQTGPRAHPWMHTHACTEQSRGRAASWPGGAGQRLRHPGANPCWPPGCRGPNGRGAAARTSKLRRRFICGRSVICGTFRSHRSPWCRTAGTRGSRWCTCILPCASWSTWCSRRCTGGGRRPSAAA